MTNDNPKSEIDNSPSMDKPSLSKQTKNNRPVPLIIKLMRSAFSIGGKISPKLTGRLAYELWITPTRVSTPDSELGILASAEIQKCRINDHEIATYHWGKTGPSVLLVHGWGGRGTQLGSFVNPLLDAGYRVISFDAPAHGRSSGKQTNLYEVSDVILGLQKHYGDFDSVISHSFGGPCIAVALKGGLKASRVISISPPSHTEGLVEKFIEMLHIPAAAGKNLFERIETTFGKTVWQDVSMKNTVKDIDIPALVIHDDNDTDVPWQEGKTVADAWHGASFIKTSGLGHRRILRDKRVINTTLEFIQTAA
jgi:pimeloyl-ACP methyl ester carboxylesterase